MFFTHNDAPPTLARAPCNCSSGNSSADCPPDWDKKGGRDPKQKLLTFMSISKDAGLREWSKPLPVPQVDAFTDTAFSATILPCVLPFPGRHKAWAPAPAPAALAAACAT